MSCSESRAQMINPNFLAKAGIPAALSVAAAYIYTKIISKRSIFPRPSSSNNPELIHHPNTLNFDSYVQHGQGEENANMQMNGNNSDNLANKLLELETHIEEIQRKERDLMKEILRYRALKEKEVVLMEIRHKMMLEKTRAEYLLKEINLVKDESKRMGGLILEYIRVVHELEDSKKENGLLLRKVRKLCKKARQRFRVTREHKLKIEAREEELLSNQEELQKKDELIQKLEDKVSQLKEVIDHLHREKIEVSNNVDIAEKSYSLDPKNEIEGTVTKEEHEKVLKELAQLQKDRVAEANELTYLKWSNACLRHELLRCHEQNKGENSSEFELEEDDHQHVETENCDCNTAISAHNNQQHASRKRRFIQRVKKWVEGGNIDEMKEKDNEAKCFGKNSVSEETDQGLFVHARKSCSSV